MKARSAISLLVPVLFAAGGCAGVLVAGSSPRGHAGHSYDIPPGHMPPPGQCRIWYPGVPPGQQPPPGDCHDLSYRVPAGGHLVFGE